MPFRPSISPGLVLALCMAALLVTACGDEREEHEVSGALTGVHPIQEYIPYYDNDHVVAGTEQSIDALDDVPRPIALLADYLETPASVDVQELETFVSESPWHFRAVAIDENRLALLSIVPSAELEPRLLDYSMRFLEYDLRTHEYVQLAEEDIEVGEVKVPEPDELGQTRDLKRHGDAVFVVHRGWNISRFDCSSAPCTYDDTEFLYNADILPVRALAPISDSTYATFARLPRNPELTFAEHFEDVVHVFDDERNQLKAFGSAYSKGWSTVNSWFFRYVGLEYSEAAAQFAFVYSVFPYLYAYDAEGELRATYQFDTEVDPVVDDTGRRGPERFNWLERNPRRSVYLLTEMEGLVVVVRESIEREDLGDDEATYRYDYHAIDLRGEEAYHIGTDSYVGEQERLVFVTEAGLVLHDGKSLHFIGP